jgi:uncharacterized membrane protein
MPSWKRDFGSGLIVLVPLLVTLIFLAWIYNRLSGVPIPVGPEPVRVLLTMLIFVLLVFSVGYLMRTAFGAVLERSLDDLMNQLPGLRVIYNASKMAVGTALSGAGDLQKPVRLEVWDGLRMTAFKTGNRAPDGREILFLPTAPNITTGFVVEVEEDRYSEIEEDVEAALTRVLSAGFGNDEETGAADFFSPTDRQQPGEVGVSEVEDVARELAEDDPRDPTTDGGTPDDSTATDDAPATDGSGDSTDA